jgi:nucleotide-binding universal stress UspA family protein
MSFRVLVPIDFTPGSERVLMWAAQLVRERGGRLDVLHVIPRLHQLDPFFRAGSLPHDTVWQISARAEQRIGQLLEPVAVAWEFHVVEGDPATGILDYSERQPVDLIVIGTHRRRGAARLLLGSVALKVVQHAAVPVATIGPDG